ncbi:MAG: hypothetical protein HQL87_04130 [Magnetococcales bacterium]|nr:hypothetical protein [Magnetococcales bacterium]
MKLYQTFRMRLHRILHTVIRDTSCSVIPAKTGIHLACWTSWIPACAGMTRRIHCDRAPCTSLGMRRFSFGASPRTPPGALPLDPTRGMIPLDPQNHIPQQGYGLKTFLAVLLLLTWPLLAEGASWVQLPGLLANSPLFLSTAVDANVFLLLDDSGSMDWEVLVPGTLLAPGDDSGAPSYAPTSTATTSNGRDRYYILPGKYDLYESNESSNKYSYLMPTEASVAATWRAREYHYNTLYYNPAITYTPWPGVDASGNPLYTNSTPAAAPMNPINQAGSKLNLTASITYQNCLTSSCSSYTSETVFPAHYYIWTDSNNNGLVDSSDAHTLVEIKPATPTYLGGTTRTDCASAPTCTYAEEIQNFANWYTYYRKRIYLAKRALGKIIFDSRNARMGMWTYNAGFQCNTAAMSNATNKLTLLQKLYGLVIAANGTPARSALKGVGDLFAKSTLSTTASTCATSSSTSPILTAAAGGTCQQNFNILITDGYWNGDSGFSAVGNADGTGSTGFEGYPYADSYLNTLADVAMYYYKTDLQPGLANQVPAIPGVDAATHQHLVNFTVGLGVTGTLDPTTDPKSAGFAWSNPTTGVDDGRKIDDLWHAAYNSRGSFYNANDPNTLETALNGTIKSIADRTGSAAAVAFNSSSLGTNSAVYLATFNSNKWSGNLSAYALDPTNGVVATTALWGAAAVLDGRDLTTSPRTILTYNGTSGVPFQWANLTTSQKNDLKTNATGGVDVDATGTARLNYLRGDTSNEGSGLEFRPRDSRLGDIIDSAPVYVGAPSLGWPDTAPFPTGSSAYSTFVAAQAHRTDMIYIGANDGMLHGFRGTDGQEMLAYVPGSLYAAGVAASGLHYLTNPSYNHLYYVDQTPTVSDVFINTSTAAAWHTVLVGTLQGGGRGVFALDVTDPAQFAESNAARLVLWEFTSATNNDLGYTFAQPTVALVRDGTNHYRWAAIFGNGYNATGNYPAKLFIVYLDGGLTGTWTLGTDYRVISTCLPTFTGSDCVGTATFRNGLATPAVVDTNGDGVADRVYAGDMKGNMWAFDLSNSSPTNWGVAYSSSGSPVPLFTATTNQSITARPVVAKNPNVADTSANVPNLMVYFGTGQYIASGDNTSTYAQSFYGIWDSGTNSLTRTNLVAQTFQSSTDSTLRILSGNSVDYTAKSGWYIDLPGSGERVVTDPIFRDNVVFFNTLIPSTNPCSGGGSGWLMSVKALNGGSPDSPVFDKNGDGKVDANDKLNGVAPSGQLVANGIPAESAILSNEQYTPTSTTTTGSAIGQRTLSGLTERTGQLSWHELVAP